MTLHVKNISISINSPKDTVYQFAANPENFSKWLAFLKSVSKISENVWNAETNLGKIEIELTPKNQFGIIDHVVKLPDGNIITNPLRVIENKSGSEIIFTLFKMPGKTDIEFEDDAKMVNADLKKLKELLEMREQRTANRL